MLISIECSQQQAQSSRAVHLLQVRSLRANQIATPCQAAVRCNKSLLALSVECKVQYCWCPRQDYQALIEKFW